MVGGVVNEFDCGGCSSFGFEEGGEDEDEDEDEEEENDDDECSDSFVSNQSTDLAG
jgi:hypothetical protein